MGNYTPEEVLDVAVELENPDSLRCRAKEMLFAYAATLRQQAARVDDEALLEIARDCGLGRHLHGVDATKAKRLLREFVDALEAALSAQPAERQGECEPVADVVTHGNLQYGKLRRDVPDGTKLYIHPAAPVGVPDVDAMVSRFLGWRLPADFAPDNGISYTPIPRHPGWTHDTHPVGTNLFTADQAKAMFEYVLAAAPSAPEGDGGEG